ncbi:hypothetical protein BURMUCF2_A1242 [Burkholderia multivorans CF2]|nr:hypothetical protein BURMUCF2_A1242 [Burkholderia multivorans CF2]
MAARRAGAARKSFVTVRGTIAASLRAHSRTIRAAARSTLGGQKRGVKGGGGGVERVATGVA